MRRYGTTSSPSSARVCCRRLGKLTIYFIAGNRYPRNMSSNNYMSIGIEQVYNICSFCKLEGSYQSAQPTMCPCGCVLPVHQECLQLALRSSSIHAVCPRCSLPWLHALTVAHPPSKRICTEEQGKKWSFAMKLLFTLIGICILGILVWFSVKYSTNS